MAPNPDIRASDADRDRVAASLREHCAEGRITMDELDERLESVYGAKTLGQLQEITSDLPEEDLYQLPVPASQAKSTASPAKPVPGDLDEQCRIDVAARQQCAGRPASSHFPAEDGSHRRRTCALDAANLLRLAKAP